MKNTAQLHFEGANKEKIDQRAFESWYSPDSILYLTNLNDRPPAFIRYVFFEGDGSAFAKQFENLILLKNRLGRAACFISKEPGIGQNHYIFGLIINNNLLVINPIGTTVHRDCYRQLATIQKNYGTKVYLSKMVIQKDLEGLVSCGAICAELMNYISTLPISEIEKVFASSQELSEKEELRYAEIDLSTTNLLPTSLRAITEANDPVLYRDAIVGIRSRHYQILGTHLKLQSIGITEQNQLLEGCLNSDEQVLVNKMVLDRKSVLGLESAPEYQRLSGGSMQHKSTKDWQSVVDEADGSSLRLKPSVFSSAALLPIGATDEMDQSAIGALVASQSSTVTSSSLPKSASVKLTITEDYLSLQKGFTWDIPQFGVITGQNGVGKTHLLWYIYQRAHGLQRDEHADRGLFPQPPAISGMPSHVEGLYQTTLIDANNLSKIDQDYAEVSQRYQSNIGAKIASPQRTSVRPTTKPTLSSMYLRNARNLPSDEYAQDSLLQSDHYSAATTSPPLAYFPLLDMVWQVAELDNFLVKRTLVSEEFNRLSEEYGLGITLQDKFINYDKIWLPDFRLYFRKQNVSEDIEFSHLSSGEKILVTILTNIVQLNVIRRIKDEGASLEANRVTDHASYVRGISRAALAERLEKELVPIKCFLLDEVDIHFHPEFTAKFLNVLKKISEISHAASLHEGLKDFGAPRIIMTTHNPTTIALAEDLGGEVYIMQRDALQKASIVRAQSKREAISVLTGGKLTVVEDVNYVLVENKDDAKFYSMVYLKFLSASFLRSHGTKLLFAPVGVKVVETGALNRLGELVANLSLTDAANKDFQEMASLVKSLKEQNDVGNGCGQVEKRAVVVEYEMNADGNGIIAETPKEKTETHEPEMIWGLLDRDKARRSRDTLYAIDVYSFECYLCMPLNLFYLMKRNEDFDKSKPKKTEFKDRLVRLEDLLNRRDADKWPLQQFLNDLTTYVINTLQRLIPENLKKANVPVKHLQLFQTGLSGQTHPLPLVNGLVVENCPSIFFEGIAGGGNGHKLLETIEFIMFGSTKDTMHTKIFGALEKIPAALLPKSLQITMEGLITSKRAQADEGVFV